MIGLAGDSPRGGKVARSLCKQGIPFIISGLRGKRPFAEFVPYTKNCE